MKHLNIKKFIWVLVVTSTLVWTGLLAANRTELTASWQAVKQLPTVVTVDVILWGVFLKWAWRWRICQRWLVSFPDLQGTWAGEILSTWVDPEIKKTISPIKAYLCIKQTFVSVSCVMYTQEMRSESYSAEFLLDPHTHVQKLVYSYLSDPKPGVRDRSAIHHGTALLDIVLSPARTLRGSYWNDRKSTGEITLRFRQKELIQGYPEGTSLA